MKPFSGESVLPTDAPCTHLGRDCEKRRPAETKSSDNRRNRTMDEQALMDFVHKAVGDVGSLLAGSMVVIGDRLGLYLSLIHI